MAYTMNEQDLFRFIDFLNEETIRKGNEIWFKKCPYCGGGNNNDKETFSINIKNGAFKCFRSSCGKQGHFVELCRDKGFKLDFWKQEKPIGYNYRPLSQKQLTASAEAIEYLENRGISREIIERYKVTSRKDNTKIIVFPFYDEEGVLQFVKYRKTDFRKGTDSAKEWCEKNTKPILFGMLQCEDFSQLVITEGEIDCLSCVTAGIKNVVSVPMGANGFTWVDLCWDWLKKFETIVIMGDCEKGEITLVDRLSKRIPKLKVVPAECYLGEKDANDILNKYGADAIQKAIKSAVIQPVKRVKRLCDVKKVNLSELPKIETGIYEVDRTIGGIYYGQLLLLTGKRGEGKSTFMSQIIAEALDQGLSCFAYSGELADYNFKSWLDLQLAGNKNLEERKNRFNDSYYVLPDEISDKINAWYANRMFLYDNGSISGTDEMESVIETIEIAIQRYGINLVCVDNLMTAMSINANDDLFRAQGRFVQRLKTIAQIYNVAIILVAHPKKGSGEFNNDDVSGSAEITNRVDIVMNFCRSKQGNEWESELSITKNRLTGALISPKEPVRLVFSNSTKRIVSYKTGNPNKHYSWENFSYCNDDLIDPCELGAIVIETNDDPFTEIKKRGISQ